MQSKAIHGNSVQEIESKLSEIINLDFKPTLAIVFMSHKRDMDGIARLLTIQQIEVFGVSSSGEFTNDYVGFESIVVMLLDLNPDYFRIFFNPVLDGDFRKSSQLIASETARIFDDPSFLVIGAGLAVDGSEIVSGLEDILGPEIQIFGGMAGDDFLTKEVSIFSANQLAHEGVLALALDLNHIKIAGLATFGWKPVGTTKTITRADNNRILEIDHKPALDVVIKYLGQDLETQRNDTHASIGQYPLQFVREEGEPVMRSIMLTDPEERSITCAEKVNVGSKIKFSLPPDFEVIENVVKEFTELKNKQMPESEAIFLFNCAGRRSSFGELLSGDEIEQIGQIWDAPMIGYFCYGEFGRSAKGKNEFHNNTCIILTMMER